MPAGKNGGGRRSCQNRLKKREKMKIPKKRNS